MTHPPRQSSRNGLPLPGGQTAAATARGRSRRHRHARRFGVFAGIHGSILRRKAPVPSLTGIRAFAEDLVILTPQTVTDVAGHQPGNDLMNAYVQEMVTLPVPIDLSMSQATLYRRIGELDARQGITCQAP